MSNLDPRDEYIELLSEYRSQIFTLIYSLIPNINDAEDIFQQTSIVLWQRFEQYEKGTSFLAWACQIARNKTYNWNTVKKRYRVLLGSDVSVNLADLVIREDKTQAEKQVRIDGLSHCMEKLKQKDSLLIKQCYGDIRSIKEIAKDMGRSQSSISNSLRRIRQSLLSCIKKYMQNEEQL